MAETSYYWQGAITGDAANAPYDLDEFLSLYLRTLFIADDTRQGPIDGYLNSLAVSNPSSTLVKLDTGAALVYGFVYFNDAAIYFDAAASGNYRLVLRADWTAQTVRAVLLGPNGGGLPALTQVAGTTWEINLCDIVSTGAALTTFTDRRVFCRPNSYRMPMQRMRFNDTGSPDDWDLPFSSTYPNAINVKTEATLMCGSVQWTGLAASSGDVSVTPPYEPNADYQDTANSYYFKPIVIVTVVNQDTDILVSVEVVVTPPTYFTIYWESISGATYTSIDFLWMTVGMKQRGL